VCYGFVVRSATLLLVGLALLFAVPSTAGAKTPPIPAWCTAETETLTDNVCDFDASDDAHRTLVIFLHGLVPRYAPWQWTQQRAVVRLAKTHHFAVLFPQGLPVGPGGAAGYAWPGVVNEKGQRLVEGWAAARKLLESRNGRPFDEVFVVGFSSGAYFAASVALRGRFAADGYAVLAGGGPTPTSSEATRVPIYVGVSGRDRHTAPAARELGHTLTVLGWPHKTDEERVGHMIADVHIAHAMAYLRGASDKRPTTASSE
jgi:predicted esterase